MLSSITNDYTVFQPSHMFPSCRSSQRDQAEPS